MRDVDSFVDDGTEEVLSTGIIVSTSEDDDVLDVLNVRDWVVLENMTLLAPLSAR